MKEIVIRPDIVERIIGHNVDSVIMGVCSSYNWLPEMREALERWYEWICPVQKVKKVWVSKHLMFCLVTAN